MFRWRAGAWYVTDHSRNGSYLDGRLLRSGEAERVAVGQALRFGGPGRPSWTLEDVSPPGPLLLPLDPAHAPVFLLPYHDLGARACLYRLEDGSWALDRDGDMQALSDGAELDLGPATFRLHLPENVEDTDDHVPEPPLLIFRVSQDEEHASLEVRFGGRCVELGERSHHYMLLTLARKRVEDAQRGHDAAAQGWMDCDRLSCMLGIDLEHLNVQVYRARGQALGAVDAAHRLGPLIERRRGQLRLCPLPLEIHRGTHFEGRWHEARGAEK